MNCDDHNGVISGSPALKFLQWCLRGAKDSISIGDVITINHTLIVT